MLVLALNKSHLQRLPAEGRGGGHQVQSGRARLATSQQGDSKRDQDVSYTPVSQSAAQHAPPPHTHTRKRKRAAPGRVRLQIEQHQMRTPSPLQARMLNSTVHTRIATPHPNLITVYAAPTKEAC